jgi:hypothetical protein
MSATKKPEPPETKVALLPSEGHTNRVVITRHVYQDTIPAKDHQDGPGWVHRFRCTETGIVRVWGFHGSRLDKSEE